MKTVPTILRSHLAPLARPHLQVLPIESAGETYTMAQEATWLGPGYFAVGRWDGSLSIFAFNDAPTIGPTIARAVNSPDHEGVQMIASVDDRTFISSNNDSSAVCWKATQDDWSDLTAHSRLEFDRVYGVANSGAALSVATVRYFVMGHAEGWVTIWDASDEQQWRLIKAIDVRAPTPTNPWGLHNVRGIAVLPSQTKEEGLVITGSEDGNLTVVRVPDGVILKAQPYNPNAQRGINSVASRGEIVLLANCAVGPSDGNLWAYRVNAAERSITLLGNARLAVATEAPQVFNFDVAWIDEADDRFFCSTEEGVIWMGTCSIEDGLEMAGFHKLSGPALGAAICIRDAQLAVAAYNLYEFTIADQ